MKRKEVSRKHKEVRCGLGKPIGAATKRAGPRVVMQAPVAATASSPGSDPD